MKTVTTLIDSMAIKLPGDIYEKIINMAPKGHAGYDEISFNYGYMRACVDIMYLLMSEEIYNRIEGGK